MSQSAEPLPAAPPPAGPLPAEPADPAAPSAGRDDAEPAIPARAWDWIDALLIAALLTVILAAVELAGLWAVSALLGLPPIATWVLGAAGLAGAVYLGVRMVVRPPTS